MRPALAARRALLAFAATLAACSSEPSSQPREDRLPQARIALPVLRALDDAPRVRVLLQTSDVATAHELGRTLGAERAFKHVPALAAWIERPQLEQLRRHPGVRGIALDEGGSAHLTEALPLAGFAPLISAGLRGDGVTVAIIDSGIDRTHPDLADAVIDEACFCSSGCCPGGLMQAFGEGSAADDNGHGTHVAGILAGTGAAAGQPGGAPATRVIAIKVLDAFNAFCCTSDLIAALDWLLQSHPEVDLINMSLGANGLYDGDCDDEIIVGPVAQAAHALMDHGAVLVASSGNNGANGLPSPACLADVISVGAVWDDDLGPHAILCSEEQTSADRIACFSNTSSTLDVLAPGAIVTSAWPGGMTRGRAGTSQAAPMVSACAALLMEAQPDATPRAVSAALRTSPVWLTDARNGQQYPRLDCGAALRALGSITDAGASDAGESPLDAAAPPLDAATEVGTDAATSADAEANEESGAPMSDAAAIHEAGADDASADASEPLDPDAAGSPGPSTDAGPGRDAMAPASDGHVPSEMAAGDEPSAPHTGACACRSAGVRGSSSAPLLLGLTLALALARRMQRRTRRHSR